MLASVLATVVGCYVWLLVVAAVVIIVGTISTTSHAVRQNATVM